MNDNYLLSDNNHLELNKKTNVVKIFFQKHRWATPLVLYAGISLFILTIFAIFLYINGVYPFGYASISSYDLIAQITPFIEHFYDVIEGKSSLFYSYAVAGGADLFGSLAYCCISPFTFIFLLFGRGNVYYATSIVLPLKIVCVACSALFFVRKRFDNIPPLIQLALALSYAFCGYLFVANTYINWVDLLIYLPLLALGFKRLVDDGKRGLFVTALCLMIYTSFSISSFSLFLTYPIMVIYVLLVSEKQKRSEVLSNVVIALLLAIFLSLPILIPALRAFLVSGRKSGVFENLGGNYSASALYSKLSYIFTDGLTLFFTVIYFSKYGVKRPIDRFLAIAGVILLVPIFFDESMKLLNFGSYMSYSLRFGFLNGFYFLFVASAYFNEFYHERKIINGKTKQNGQLFSTTSNETTATVMLAIIVGFIVGLYFLAVGIENESFVESFPSRFAHSLGGLEATAIVFGCMALIALLGTLLVKFNKLNVKLFSLILLISVCIQSIFYGGYLVVGNHYTPTRYDRIGALTDYVNDNCEDEQTRIKMNGNFITACYPFVFKTNGVSVFSSVIDSTNFTAPNLFGYAGNGKNSMKSYNGKFLGDCIFGYEYFITEGNNSRYYLEELEVYDQLYNDQGQLVDVGEYKLYKNKYSLPHAYAVPGAVSEYEKSSLAYAYDSILKMLGGESIGIEWVDVKVTVHNDQGVYRVQIPVKEAGNYFFVSEFENNENIKYVRTTYSEEDLLDLSKSSEFSLGYGSTGAYNIYLQIKDDIKFTTIMKSCKAFRVPDSAVKSIHKKATSQTVDFKCEPNRISVKLTAEKGSKLFLNYVALDGHTVYVNGKQVEFLENELDYMYLNLEEGENDVQIVYNSPYIKLIFIGLILALCFSILYYFLIIRSDKLVKKLKNVIFYLGLAVGVLVLAFFFVMPILYCAYKNFNLLIKTIISLF